MTVLFARVIFPWEKKKSRYIYMKRRIPLITIIDCIGREAKEGRTTTKFFEENLEKKKSRPEICFYATHTPRTQL